MTDEELQDVIKNGEGHERIMAIQELSRRSTQENKKSDEKAKNQEAIKHIANNIGDLEPRYWGYGLGAIGGMSGPGQTLANIVSPTEARYRVLEHNQKLEALKNAENGYEPLEGNRFNIKNASANRNYANKITQNQAPETVLNEVQHYGRGPGGAWDISEKDAANMAKINALGHGNYKLTGEGVPPPAENPFQLMLPDEVSIAKKTTPSSTVLSKMEEVSGPLRTYVKGVLMHPVVKGALHGANILGSVAQGASDIYNQDPYGMAIDAGQVIGSLAGAPEVAIPAGEALRYIRENPESVKNTLREMGSQYSPEYLP